MISVKFNFFNKILSTIQLSGSVFYYIPKTYRMLDWLDSGIIDSYFYLIAPLNFIVIIFAAISALAFLKHIQRQRVLLILNILGLILMICWFPFVYRT